MVLLVDDSLLKELQVADDGNKEQSMTKKSRLRRLANKWIEPPPVCRRLQLPSRMEP